MNFGSLLQPRVRARRTVKRLRHDQIALKIIAAKNNLLIVRREEHKCGICIKI